MYQGCRKQIAIGQAYNYLLTVRGCEAAESFYARSTEMFFLCMTFSYQEALS